MHSVLALEGAVLLLFQAFRSVALFFGRRIVATFALGALHNYQFASHIKHSTFLQVYYDIIPDRLFGRPGITPLFERINLSNALITR